MTVLMLGVASLAALVMSGCGTSASSTTTAAAATPQMQTSPAFVIGTDAPLPSVTSFAVQLQSIDAMTASGGSVPLLSGSPTVDFARFNGLQTLLDMNDVPVGTYTSVAITLGPATIGYLNTSAGAAPTTQTEPAVLSQSTVTVTLATPLVVAQTGPVGLRMDFDLHKSIQVGSNGQITGNVTPTFDLSAVMPTDTGGYVDEFDAAVVSVNANAQTFVVQGPHGHDYTVQVNGQTDWDNGESLSMLTTSSIVEISGVMDKADSTLDADDIGILSRDGFYAGGLLTSVQPSTGMATSFQMYVRGTLPTGTGVGLGQIAQVDLTGSEKFSIHRRHNSLTQYLFNAGTLLPGQHVAVGGAASGAASTQDLTVKRVWLSQWGYNGKVVAGSVNASAQTFQIQAAGFAGVLIPQTITVYADPSTTFRDGLTGFADLQSEAAVRVVGLLMKDAASGGTVLLAKYVDAQTN